MRFRYFPGSLSEDRKAKVVDEEVGIELFIEGRGEVGILPFMFFDPNSMAHSYYGAGKFPFEANLIQRVEKRVQPNGSTTTAVLLDGFEINFLSLEKSFEPYLTGDKVKLDEVCALITAGLKEWLHARDNLENATIKFVSA